MNKKRKIYISLSFAACFALITALSIFISSLSSKTTALDTNVKHSAVLFSGGAAGGYVLIGVIGFILGAAVTLLCIKNKKD